MCTRCTFSWLFPSENLHHVCVAFDLLCMCFVSSEYFFMFLFAKSIFLIFIFAFYSLFRDAIGKKYSVFAVRIAVVFLDNFQNVHWVLFTAYTISSMLLCCRWRRRRLRLFLFFSSVLLLYYPCNCERLALAKALKGAKDGKLKLLFEICIDEKTSVRLRALWIYYRIFFFTLHVRHAICLYLFLYICVFVFVFVFVSACGWFYTIWLQANAQ